MKGLVYKVLLLLAGTALLGADLKIEVKNQLDRQLSKEVVAVEWSALKKLHGNISQQNARVLDSNGSALLSQVVDNDGDGSLDELLFVADLAGNETRQFKVVADPSLKMPEATARAYARYVPERKGDFAWENDVVGFRAYGPGLVDGRENCGFDCFMKRVDYPIIDGWYGKIKKAQSYHIDTGEGHDGYHVGDGLGCGGSAVWHEGRMYKSNVYKSSRQFANGPIRAAFELSYGPWEVAGQQVTETKRITIDLGSRLFRVDDAFFVDGKPAKLDIAIGVQTHDGKADAYENRQKGYLYCWEKIDKHHLGTGIVLDPHVIESYKLIEKTTKDTGHALFVVSTSGDGMLTYYAGYGWEKAKQIVTREDWETYLENFAADTNTHVEVSVGR